MPVGLGGTATVAAARPGPCGLSAIASTPVARSLPGESGLAYQWPGAYFELNFEGNSAYFQLGEGAAIMRVSVDGQALPLLTAGRRRLRGVWSSRPARTRYAWRC